MLVEIDCREATWKTRLKLGLQNDESVYLLYFDYTVDGQFCEMLALSHSYNFKLDARGQIGLFTKRL